MKRLIIVLLAFTLPLFAELLEIGSKAPQFNLRSYNGDEVALSSFKEEKFLVIVFYPGDNTPVCTKQLCELRDNYNDLLSLDVQVLGINPASAESHKKFADKNGYQFPILVDKDKSVAKLYKRSGALGNKRAVYIIDKNGVIIFAKSGKPPVDDIISIIKNSK